MFKTTRGEKGCSQRENSAPGGSNPRDTRFIWPTAIPDPLPVLGDLDDLILIPLGMALALRTLPPEVMAECRLKAQDARRDDQPANWIAAGVIVSIWRLLGGDNLVDLVSSPITLAAP